MRKMKGKTMGGGRSEDIRIKGVSNLGVVGKCQRRKDSLGLEH